VLRELLGSLGEGSEIRPPLHCDYGYQTHVGARAFINFGVVLLDVATITIGDDVQVGPYVQFLTPIHPVEVEPRRAKLEAAKPIVVGDNVYLGGGVIACPGVSIGESTVVGTGAVVTRTCPPTWSLPATLPASSARCECRVIARRIRRRGVPRSRSPAPFGS
jgi:maltose O-acetyltransferase